MVKFPSHLFPQLFQKGVARSMKPVNLRRHSFSGVILSQCHPTFWEGGRSLQNFQAVMLSFVQKCFFSLLSRQSQMHEYHTELQGISWTSCKGKELHRIFSSTREIHPPLRSHTYMCKLLLLVGSSTPTCDYNIPPNRKQVI